MANTSVLSGVDGELTLATPDALAGGIAAQYFEEGNAVGRVTNVTVAVTTDVRPFHELGSRQVSELRAGNLHVSGTVERAYINGALLSLMLGPYAGGTETNEFRIPVFDMTIALRDPLDPAGERVPSKLNIFGVVFDTWQFHLPEDTFVMEKAGFKAQRIAVVDADVETAT